MSWKSNLLPRLVLAGVFTLQGLGPFGAEPLAEAAAAQGADLCLSDVLCHAHYQRARTNSRDGAHEAALTAYRMAYRRRPAAWLLLGIGRTLHKLGRPKEALAHYQQYHQQVASPPPEMEARLAEYLKEVSEELAVADSQPPPASALAVPKVAPADGSASNPAPEASNPPPLQSTSAAASAPAPPEPKAPELVPSTRLPTLVPNAAMSTSPDRSVAPLREGESTLSRRTGLGVTLGLSGALGVAALGAGLAAIQNASYATGFVFVGAQAPAEAQTASDRSRALALTSDILIGAGATTLVVGLLATYLRKPARTPTYAVSLSGRGASLAVAWPSP